MSILLRRALVCGLSSPRFRSSSLPAASIKIAHFSSGSNEDSGSHSDFAPKKKVQVPEGMDDVLKLIESQVKGNDILLYMKGTPARPQCGFSMKSVKILQAAGADFSSVNILEYPAIREGAKIYSEWPTFPQLYIKGEFVGGCDIMTTMYNEGDLQKLLKSHNLVDEEEK